MGIIDMWGFEWGLDNNNASIPEGIIVLEGTPVWENSNLPPGGSSQFAIRNVNNGRARCLLPLQGSSLSGTRFWLHFNWWLDVNNTANVNQYVSWNQAGVEIGRVSLVNNTNEVRVFINGVATADSAWPLGIARWHRIHVFVDLQAGATGIIRVYTDGNLAEPVVEITATSTNPLVATLDGLGLGLSQSSRFLDDLILMDPDDGVGVTDPEEIAWITIPPKQPISDGNYTAWTAAGSPGGASDYEYIDESPPVDTDYIRATAAGQASTFGFDASTSTRVLGAKWKGRFLRGDAVAGVNMNIRQRDVSATTDYDTPDIPVPGDGYIYRTFAEKPGGGLWTAADFDDTEFGVVSKT